MDLAVFQYLLDDQGCAITRRQLIAGGATDADIRRWVRRKELRRVHKGVYVNHTGPLTWINRAWAAVLYYWPAALTHDSAVNRAGDLIHVAIEAERRVDRLPGVRVHRLRSFDGRVQWSYGPPRVRLEDALLTKCRRAATRVEALAIVSDACRRRITTPARLADELQRRTHAPHRRWLLAVLDEAAEGVHSVLESSYRRRVERAHGLPRSDRQRHERTEDGVVYRDAAYRRYGVIVELDGRVGHELNADKWDDHDRDLLAATTDLITLRLGWRQAEVTPCRTAGRLATVFRNRGWRGTPRRCGPACAVEDYFRAA